MSECLSRRAVHQVRASAAIHRIHDKYVEYDKKQLPMRLYYDESIARSEEEDCDAELRGCVRFVSSLSRVDGLIHCDSELRVTGFGAEIVIGEDPKSVMQSNAADPENKDLVRLEPSHFGMRHRSMMRYCGRYPSAIGFVISQDGDIRAVTAVGSRVYVWENVMVLHLFTEYIKRMNRRLKKKYGDNFGTSVGGDR